MAAVICSDFRSPKEEICHYFHFFPFYLPWSNGARLGFNPWVGKIPWRRKWHPTPVLLPGKSHGQRILVGCSPWGRKESDTTSDFPFTFHFHALEKEMATHSSVLAWRIPGVGEPGGLPSMGSHRVGHDWENELNWTKWVMMWSIILYAYWPSLHLLWYFFKSLGPFLC